MEIVKFHKDPSEDSCLGKSLGKELDYFKNNLQTCSDLFSRLGDSGPAPAQAGIQA